LIVPCCAGPLFFPFPSRLLLFFLCACSRGNSFKNPARCAVPPFLISLFTGGNSLRTSASLGFLASFLPRLFVVSFLSLIAFSPSTLWAPYRLPGRPQFSPLCMCFQRRVSPVTTLSTSLFQQLFFARRTGALIEFLVFFFFPPFSASCSRLI